MSMTLEQKIEHAAAVVAGGGVIAYPTEGVYGLGCDPTNYTAVKRIIELKQREADKGLIVVAANWQQVKIFTVPLEESHWDAVSKTWPGPTTWLFPASEWAPSWITGKYSSIALRISAFKLVRELCEQCGPLVSTSLNLASQPALTSAVQINNELAEQIDYILEAPVGNVGHATPIYNAVTGEKVR
jgi:L-threonylcarbamoyladenylate synthase